MCGNTHTQHEAKPIDSQEVRKEGGRGRGRGEGGGRNDLVEPRKPIYRGRGKFPKHNFSNLIAALLPASPCSIYTAWIYIYI